MTDLAKNVAQEKMDGTRSLIETKNIRIKFQLGPVKEFGTNGCQIDDVIQILVKRLEGFQRGQFRCLENEVAITKLQGAIRWLTYRTRGREQGGVEGKNIE